MELGTKKASLIIGVNKGDGSTSILGVVTVGSELFPIVVKSFFELCEFFDKDPSKEDLKVLTNDVSKDLVGFETNWYSWYIREVPINDLINFTIN